MDASTLASRALYGAGGQINLPYFQGDTSLAANAPSGFIINGTMVSGAGAYATVVTDISTPVDTAPVDSTTYPTVVTVMITPVDSTTEVTTPINTSPITIETVPQPEMTPGAVGSQDGSSGPAPVRGPISVHRPAPRPPPWAPSIDSAPRAPSMDSAPPARTSPRVVYRDGQPFFTPEPTADPPARGGRPSGKSSKDKTCDSVPHTVPPSVRSDILTPVSAVRSASSRGVSWTEAQETGMSSSL